VRRCRSKSIDSWPPQKFPIVEGYGLTEASPVVAVNLHGQTRIGTVGCALKDIEVKTAPDGDC